MLFKFSTFLTFAAFAVAAPSSLDIILKSGLNMKISKKSLISQFEENNSTTILDLNQLIFNSIKKENTNFENAKVNNNYEILKRNELAATLNKINDELIKGESILNEFDHSMATKTRLNEEITIAERSIKKLVDSMKPENFPENFANINFLTNLKKRNEIMKNENLDFEAQMNIAEGKMNRIKSTYEIIISRFDPDISSKISGVQSKTQVQNRKLVEMAAKISDARTVIQNEKNKEETLLQENQKIKDEVEGHESFLYYYNNGEFKDQIDKCVKRKNDILEFLKSHEDQLIKILSFSPLKDIEKTRISLLSLADQKRFNFENLTKNEVNENLESLKKVEIKEIERLKAIESQIEGFSVQIKEFNLKNLKDLESVKFKIHECNRQIIETKREIKKLKGDKNKAIKKMDFSYFAMMLFNLFSSGAIAIILRSFY